LWSALWVRNSSLPVYSVEVKDANHSNWYKMERASDGSFVDETGLSTKGYTLRITAIDGQVIEETLNSSDPGELIRSAYQF